MLTIRFWAPVLAGAFLLPVVARAQFASGVTSYSPGTGFAAGFTNSSAALGAPAAGGAVTPFAPPSSKSQIVSIGAGGEITLQFNTPIMNDPADPYGNNLILFANSFFISSGGNVSGLFSHAVSAVVQVSQDDATWYTLNPALAPAPGQLFPTDGAGNPLIPVNPALALNSFTGDNLAGIRALYAGSAGGTGYDLAWAQDSGGNSVNLPVADFVRIEVQSGVLDLDAVSEVAPVPEALSTVWMLALVCGGLFWGSRRIERVSRFIGVPAGTVAALSTALALLGGLAATSVNADPISISENFATDPATQGWQTFGNASLFQWDATNHDLAVTWDSSQPNSYYYHPIGTFFSSADDFTISFDLLLSDAAIAGGTFELAAGLLNLSNAISPDFLRGTGYNANNEVEFDYFMDPFYGNSVAASELDYTSLVADIYDDVSLDTNTTYHVSITHASGDTLVSGQITVSNQLFSSFASVPYGPYVEPGFDDFRVDTISISSYSDVGAYGASILAHGTIANLAVTATTRPIGKFKGQMVGTAWQAHFVTRTNWFYTLERSIDLQSWTAVSPTVSGIDDILVLQDPNPPAIQAFYRIHVSQP